MSAMERRMSLPSWRAPLRSMMAAMAHPAGMRTSPSRGARGCRSQGARRAEPATVSMPVASGHVEPASALVSAAAGRAVRGRSKSYMAFSLCIVRDAPPI